MAYIRPAGTRINDTWQGHKDRDPPSKEPGVDYFATVGTEVRAPADGFVRAIKNTNTEKTGRLILLQTGRDWHRALHLSRIKVARVGEAVTQGQVIALSGGSADGKDDGVPQHLHWTFWSNLGDAAPRIGTDPTSDFERFVGTAGFAGTLGLASEEDDMFTEDDRRLLKLLRTELLNTKAGVWTGGKVRIDGVVREFDFGVLPIVTHNQALIARLMGQVAALQSVVEQLTTTQNVAIDMDAVRDAAERGTREAQSDLIDREISNIDPIQDVALDSRLEGRVDPGAGEIDLQP